jgi:hypothetical protein
MTKVKVKTSSSSLFNLSKKFGVREGSVSCSSGVRDVRGILNLFRSRCMPPTCINSTGPRSPDVRVAVTLVAGNALGTMVIALRFRGFEMTREEMDTGKRFWVSRDTFTRVCDRKRGFKTSRGEERPTSILIPEGDG